MVLFWVILDKEIQSCLGFDMVQVAPLDFTIAEYDVDLFHSFLPESDIDDIDQFAVGVIKCPAVEGMGLACCIAPKGGPDMCRHIWVDKYNAIGGQHGFSLDVFQPLAG